MKGMGKNGGGKGWSQKGTYKGGYTYDGKGKGGYYHEDKGKGKGAFGYKGKGKGAKGYQSWGVQGVWEQDEITVPEKEADPWSLALFNLNEAKRGKPVTERRTRGRWTKPEATAVTVHNSFELLGSLMEDEGDEDKKEEQSEPVLMALFDPEQGLNYTPTGRVDQA